MDNIYHLLVKFGELRHNCVFYTSSSRGEVSKVCMNTTEILNQPVNLF